MPVFHLHCTAWRLPLPPHCLWTFLVYNNNGVMPSAACRTAFITAWVLLSACLSALRRVPLPVPKGRQHHAHACACYRSILVTPPLPTYSLLPLRILVLPPIIRTTCDDTCGRTSCYLRSARTRPAAVRLPPATHLYLPIRRSTPFYVAGYHRLDNVAIPRRMLTSALLSSCLVVFALNVPVSRQSSRISPFGGTA